MSSYAVLLEPPIKLSKSICRRTDCSQASKAPDTSNEALNVAVYIFNKNQNKTKYNTINSICYGWLFIKNSFWCMWQKINSNCQQKRLLISLTLFWKVQGVRPGTSVTQDLSDHSKLMSSLDSRAKTKRIILSPTEVIWVAAWVMWTLPDWLLFPGKWCKLLWLFNLDLVFQPLHTPLRPSAPWLTVLLESHIEGEGYCVVKNVPVKHEGALWDDLADFYLL